MFDVGMTELLLIGVVALVVVGPKDLPHLFHALGRFTAKARSMAREFSSAMDDAAKNAGIDDATKSLNDLKSMTSKRALGLDALDRAADRFEKWDPKMPQPRATAAQADPSAPDVTPDAAPTPDTAPAAVNPEPAEAGKRQLHAVRRSDRKDD